MKVVSSRELLEIPARFHELLEISSGGPCLLWSLPLDGTRPFVEAAGRKYEMGQPAPGLT
jgi:hypothetical protein